MIGASLMENVIMDDITRYETTTKDNFIVLDGVVVAPKVKESLKHSGFGKRLSELEDGLDTPITTEFDPKGVDLSGGEAQKVAIARAFYIDADILIMDEPSSALDPIAENNLYLKYRELTKGKTSIYISHRFASTRFCDRIVLLGDGVIQESGTHEELMEQNGQYAYMFGVQSKYYKEGEIDA